MRFKLNTFLTAFGLAFAIGGAAQACDNSAICGSGWMDRGSYSNGSNCSSCGGGSTGGSGYGQGNGYGYGGGGGNGYGGAGGSGYGYGGGGGNGYGGWAQATNNNTVANTNNNTNKVSNSGNNWNDNSSRNTAYGGSASIAKGAVQNSNGQGQGQEQTQSQTLTNSGNSSLSNAGNSNVNVNYNNVQKQQPVATAYAAPLVAGADTCMGSTSVGGQGITIGFSVASTWTDKNCNRLKNSRELNAMGMGSAACELLAMDKEVAEALRRSGVSCETYGRPMIQPVVNVPPPPPQYIPEPMPIPAPPPEPVPVAGCHSVCVSVPSHAERYGPPPRYDGERG